LPKPHDGHGDLFIIVQVALPTELNERERELYRELAKASSFNPRGHFVQAAHGK
jgi:curved DNA-binding protein